MSVPLRTGRTGVRDAHGGGAGIELSHDEGFLRVSPLREVVINTCKLFHRPGRYTGEDGSSQAALCEMRTHVREVGTEKNPRTLVET
jgi:hypothetical protein